MKTYTEAKAGLVTAPGWHGHETGHSFSTIYES